ncbi:MAG: metalloregulator ArsR/SmtB family transcription factor [Planctomycetales bacterium]
MTTPTSVVSQRGRKREKEETISTPSESASSEQDARSPELLPNKVVQKLVDVFKLLSDPTRLKILLFLVQEKELHVRALCDRLGQSQPAVSHHLALLRGKDLITRRREGKHNFYSLEPETFQILLDTLFGIIPEAEGHIRVENTTLRYDSNGRME